MKKLLLATALVAVSISATEANWGGFYARGGLSATGAGTTNKLNTVATGADQYALGMMLEIAGGWGMTVANALYLGVDAQVGNFGVTYVGYGATGATSQTAVKYSPNLQARIGWAAKSALPFFGIGIGYDKTASDSRVVAPAVLPEGLMTWSIRVGSDFKVTENFFVGVYGQYVATFNKDTGTAPSVVTSGASTTTVGFTAGYQF